MSGSNNWDNYRFFLAAAEAGSLSAAARELGVTQPTVGRHIEELERQLDARLFDRMSDGLALTAAGENVFPTAEQIRRAARVIEQRVSGHDVRLAGRVRVTTAEGLAVFWLGSRLPKLRDRFPEIEIELIVGATAFNLLRGEADIALRVGDPVCDQLVGRRVAEARGGLYAAESYLALRGEPASLDELSDHTVIESVLDLADIRQAQALRDAAPQARIGLHCNNLCAQWVAARAGVGVMPLPAYVAAAAPELKRILSEDFNVPLDIWVLTHVELRHAARIRAVIDYLGAELKRDMPILMGET